MPVATPPLNPPAPNPPVREGILRACRRRARPSEGGEYGPPVGCAAASKAGPTPLPFGLGPPQGLTCHARKPRPRRGKSLQRARAHLKPLPALGAHRPPRAGFTPSLVACARLACPQPRALGPRARHGYSGPATARRPFCPAALVLRRASRARAQARNRTGRVGRADPCSHDRRRPTKRGCHVGALAFFFRRGPH